MGKKGGKEVSAGKAEFIPMATDWPGKISNEDLFAQFSQQTRAQLSALAESPLVALRISQLGMKNFTEFMIVVPASISVMRLQLEIAKSQFDGSVLPSDIVIFTQNVEKSDEKIEKRMLKREKAVNSTAGTPNATSSVKNPSSGNSGTVGIEHLIGISKEFICIDETRTLLSYFPEMKTFRLPKEMKECTTPVFLRDLMMGKEPTYVSKRTKRYNDTYAEDKIELKAAAKPLAKIKDYGHPTFPIYFDVKEYCKIKTYKSNFEQLIKQDTQWMMQPTNLSSTRELLYNTTEPDYIHSPLVLYEFGKGGDRDAKRRHPVSAPPESPEKIEETDKKKGGLSFKTIAFLKNKSKVKKTDADKRIEARPPLPKALTKAAVPESTEGLQMPNSARPSVFRNSVTQGLFFQARDSVVATQLGPPALDLQEKLNLLNFAPSQSRRGSLQAVNGRPSTATKPAIDNADQLSAVAE